MQKTKKHFLGMVGLALVALLTIVAYGIPSPEASATEGNVDVQVMVGEPNMNNRINTPRDGDVVVKPELEISSSYSQVTKIEYFLTYNNADGQEVRVPVGSFAPTEDSGTNTFAVNLDGYGGFNNYRLTSVAYGNNGAQREDTVAFAYRAINVYYNGQNDTNKDPQLKAEVNEKVDKIQVQVYDKDNNPVFVDENGTERPIIVDKSAIDPETGELLIDLPFEQYGVPEGDYRAVVVTYDENDVILSIDTIPFTYSLNTETPNVPNTGSMLESLNISRLDYLLTGLIAFGAVAGFAIYLICRKNNRR